MVVAALYTTGWNSRKPLAKHVAGVHLIL
jgi:hypothetical protein